MKCSREDCNYTVHTNIGNNGGTHCCKSCRDDRHTHGVKCEKIRYIDPSIPTSKTIKIAVVGTHQSGSTRVFNMVRLLYESVGKSVYSCFNYIHDKDDMYDVIVNKSHDTGHNNVSRYDFVILPIRHLFDCALSGKKRKFKRFTNYKAHCHSNIRFFNKFERNASLIFRYESYNLTYVKELCAHLKLEVPEETINKIMDQLHDMLHSKTIVINDADFLSRRDEEYKKTLLTQAHNTSGGKSNKFLTEMTKEEIASLMEDEEIHKFLKKLKYI
jgi:hypothetical protein